MRLGGPEALLTLVAGQDALSCGVVRIVRTPETEPKPNVNDSLENRRKGWVARPSASPTTDIVGGGERAVIQDRAGNDCRKQTSNEKLKSVA